MTLPPRKAWSVIYANQDFLHVSTLSGYHNAVPDPEGRDSHLLPSVSDVELGSAVLQALAASRFLFPWDHPDFYDIPGRVVPAYEAWVREVMSRHHYKTKRAMFGQMKQVHLERQEGIITIHPSHHDDLESWSGEGIGEADWVILPPESSAAQVGGGVRIALERCS